ncbi:MAG: GTPase HflX [Acidobacteriota bacterium]
MEKAILVGIYNPAKEKRLDFESLEELYLLARSAGAIPVAKIIQKKEKISPDFFIGKGKVSEITDMAKGEKVDLIIFNENLSGSQIRNLETEINCRVIDRTQLILDIFAQRAKSKEGKLQVELAQYSYLLPRLTGKGVLLSRLGGGIGTRGPGEAKLEMDRRIIRKKIHKIKKEIENLKRRRRIQRKRRRTGLNLTVSLVGYTSTGKTTLFNRITLEKGTISPLFFTTLDPVLRRVNFSDGLYFWLSDTVGFIKKLPLELIEAFKATLEEVVESSLILHMVDLTNKDYLGQMEAVEEITDELGIPRERIIRVMNKIDLLEQKEELLRRNSLNKQAVFISSKTGEGVDFLLKMIRETLFPNFLVHNLEIPKERNDILRYIFVNGVVLNKYENGDFMKIKCGISKEALYPIKEFLQTEGVL